MNVEDKSIFNTVYEYLLNETETLQCFTRKAFIARNIDINFSGLLAAKKLGNIGVISLKTKR